MNRSDRSPAGGEPAATIRTQIQAAAGTFPRAEARVGRALLAEFPLAGLETVSKLADRAGVSGPTVLRFATRLGFDGFPEFQQALRLEVQERLGSPLALYDRGMQADEDEVLRISQKVFAQGIEATFAELAAPEYRAVVELLADRRRPVLCMGGRFTQVAAYYLAAHLNMLRPNAGSIGLGPVPVADELIDVGHRHVLVVFDYRRHQRDVIGAARRAASRRATIVLFTDPWLSPIADFADHVLTSRVEAPSPFDSLVPGLALVETVVAGLSARLGKGARERMEELERLRSGSTLDAEFASSVENSGGSH
jgi:DNA-binding MurR/RpiR family transcriptional regulator